MKRKIFSILFALVLVLSLGLVTAVPVAAQETLLVGPGEPYTTIQDAIDAADPGDTISVAAGIYDEQVVITLGLTLQGAGDTTVIRPSAANILTQFVNTPWIAGTKDFAGIIAVDTADGAVTVKSLKVDGVNVDSAPVGSNWIAGVFYSETAGVIDGVTVVNMETTTFQPRTNGIYLSAATATVSVEVKNCTVNNYNRGGIYGFGSKLTVDIHDNDVVGPGFCTETQVPNGIMLMNGVQGTVGPNNTVSNHKYPPADWSSTGIALWDVDGVTVEGNFVTDCDLGIALTGFAGAAGNTIQDNTVDGNLRAGVFLETSGTINNTITGNIITNNLYGIEFMGSLSPTYDNPGDEAGPGNVAHFNDIMGNTVYGVKSFNPDILFDATLNWWGHASGPDDDAELINGSGDGISVKVDADPWAIDEACSTFASTSGVVGLITRGPVAVVGFSVSPTSINFGTVSAGATVLGDTLTVTNTGTDPISVTAELTADTKYKDPDEDSGRFYTDALELNASKATPDGVTYFGSWTDTQLGLESIAVGISHTVTTGLTVPSEIRSGITYTGTVVFWVEQVPVP